MSTYRLQQLLSPQSIALIGISARKGSLGRAVLANIRAGGFGGRIDVVHPRHKTIDEIGCVPTISALSRTPDLAIIMAPASSVVSIVAEAANKGVAAVAIITAGLGHGSGSVSEQVEAIAHAHGMRLLGPNCLGVIAPHANLNASFAAAMPPAGDLAVIAQSGAIGAALSDWGIQHAIGFSAIVSVGDQLDIDFGDLLDHFALDRRTRAMLLYIESIKDARKFMSAARAAARVKPVVIIKAGRHAEGARAAATHTGALAGSDAVYDAAFRRAGLLRVFDLAELFDAAETLGRYKKLQGSRLAILTNGGGAGVLAVDRLADLGGVAAELSDATRTRLDAVLPATWSKSNPVDIIGDADAERYRAALETLIGDPSNDAVLVLNVQTALAPATHIAKAVAAVVAAERSRRMEPKPVFASWIGNDHATSEIFDAASVPHYPTEAEAIRGFMHLARYQDAARSLMETPPAFSENFRPDERAARVLVQNAVQEGRSWLDPIEMTQVFQAYGIPVLPHVTAGDPAEAARAALKFFEQGNPVAVKILSRDITHKSDVGGVRLNLRTEDDVRGAAAEIIANTKRARPKARIDGVVVQPMLVRPKARELIAGIADDPTFGPVIVFGRGGTAVEQINDKALALPPLDLKLARDLIGQTRVSRILGRYRDVPAVKEDAVADILVKLAQMAADIPEIKELDINPLLADETGVMALDARVAIAPAVARFQGVEHSRFAVRPYPKQWERHITLDDGRRLLVRPVRPEDEALFVHFFCHVSETDLRLRFFAPVKEFDHQFIARLTQIDYARAMAFIAIDEASSEMLGVVRLHADADYRAGEFAILVRTDLKGRGLGWRLMQMMIEYACKEGLNRIHGQVLWGNSGMLRMCRELGFELKPDPEDPTLSLVSLSLTERVGITPKLRASM